MYFKRVFAKPEKRTKQYGAVTVQDQLGYRQKQKCRLSIHKDSLFWETSTFQIHNSLPTSLQRNPIIPYHGHGTVCHKIHPPTPKGEGQPNSSVIKMFRFIIAVLFRSHAERSLGAENVNTPALGRIRRPPCRQSSCLLQLPRPPVSALPDQHFLEPDDRSILLSLCAFTRQ